MIGAVHGLRHTLLALVLAILPAMTLAAPASDKPAAVAMAVHQSYVGYWVVTGRKNERAASKAALAMCNKATGGGCNITIAATPAEFIVGQGMNGDLIYAMGGSPDDAQRQFDARCMATYGRHCPTGRSFTVSIKLALESGPLERRKFAAIAGEFASSGDPSDRDPRVWVVTGQASWNDAITKAMAGCTAALARAACKHVTVSGPVHIGLYRDVAGSTGGFNFNLSAQEVIGDIDTLCKAAGNSCEIIALRTAKEEAVAEYDLQTTKGVPL